MYEFTDDLDYPVDGEHWSEPTPGTWPPKPLRGRVRDGATYFARCPAGRTLPADRPHELWWSWGEFA